MSEQIKIIKTRFGKEVFKILREIENSQNLRTVILHLTGKETFECSDEVDEKLLELIEHFPKPIILTVQNNISGILFKIVLASHICLASDSAMFQINNKELLRKNVGSKKAGKLETIDDSIDAKTALDIGFINKIINESDLENESIKIARSISKLAPIAIRSSLKAVNSGLEMSLEDGLKLEIRLFSEIFATEDMREGTSAFLEKRKPDFTGK